ncbi:alpha-amylase family glycosyl hydrolase [Olivibacter domesticus]|uniref:Glycosidase n=1 Tax=Olivibacter domesticus TaxID=407022 RepID=A0A1H7LA65_OLID1|nr:alpha-amylase family glycosyl hydrolase [Olivibacter domesticus]SEK95744.1 Glycosidase [Olivibacter domesticus]
MKKIAATLLWLFLLSVLTNTKSHAQQKEVKDEVIYHVFQRSFYDSNGDSHGDLNGLKEKLNYLQNLGVTSILMTPLYESVYYHNYYAIDFKKIDPKYGTLADYLNLVKEVHKRGMKIYMDMETQYVTEDHLWWRDSFGNPGSAYSNYILYDDSAQLKPSSIVFNLTELLGYDGTTRKITTVNLNNKEVQNYNLQLFKYWLDPNGDGNFDDGVDGFRLDHMMDDLDNKGILINLFKTFWVPLLTNLKSVNPHIKFMAEQADWLSYGIDYLKQGGVDAVFAFRIQQAVRTLDKKKIEAFADTTFSNTPKGKEQIMFIENHDIPRFATVVKENPGKLRVGAAINLLIGGIPSIYYGQEIGMLGNAQFGKYGKIITDANEIPSREAFEWYKEINGRGMAFWYKGTGPWWDESNVKPNDGISFEEQEQDKRSLWNFYKSLLVLRKRNHALINGDYMSFPNSNSQVISFIRASEDGHALVVVNLSDQAQHVRLNFSSVNKQLVVNQLENLFGGMKGNSVNENEITLQLKNYDVQVFKF